MRKTLRVAGRQVVSLTALMLLTAGCAFANPAERKQPEPNSPSTVGANPTPTSSAIQESDAERQRRGRELGIQERIGNWTVILGLVGIAGVIVGFLTVWVTKRAADAAKASADEAKRAGDVAAGALALSQRAERAYVTMSHEPPGVEISTAALAVGGPVANQDATIRVKVTNSGNTPARITAVSLRYHIGRAPLPNVPAYEPAAAQPVAAFLVKNDHFVHERTWSIPAAQITEIQSVANLADPNPMKLWVFGYIDYVDQFSVRHRSGYARVYDPNVDRNRPTPAAPASSTGVVRWNTRNNLPFETRPGYNYDLPRREGEGNDWNEPVG